MSLLLFVFVCYLESGLCICIECRVWVLPDFELRLSTRVAFLLQRPIVGRVFTVFLGCCILFLGSAIGCWLFAVTVYWMFGSVACLLVDGHLDECGLCGVCSLAFFFKWIAPNACA